ncbi:MAG: 23S rRNA (pseudouridine(1915)-N(3))-methyltransferase RlmH [Gemmatimonadaceae bacterium]|nr:23S rRNA (pseudouridine(1915)-N(3))-methyltransferase RlmH [Gemmatimonadaceae bacterium]
MRVIVVVVGKARHPALGAAARGYEERAARYWPLEVRHVRQEMGADQPSARALGREGMRIIEAAGARSTIVACDATGKRMTSVEFAQWLQGERESARDICFAIGGAHGLSRDVLGAAQFKLSLAPWTLAHELARLVLAEQLYRAGTIVRREPYNK